MTDLLRLAVLILFGATLIVAVSSRLGLPSEVLLLGGSLLLSLVPGLPHLHLKPDLVFYLFLPPILFQAAYFTSWRDFKANRRPIALLAVGLVLFTTVTVAVILKLLVPRVPWPVGFILGAMVSPPDASAATSITRKLGVPRRLVTIIEGESLVNDATALIAYRFALVAALTGAFSFFDSCLRFLFVAFGGVAIGLVIGWAGMQLVRYVAETRAQILVSFLTAFSAYLVGESLHVSGVISTVTAGLYFGRCLPAHSAAQTRIEGKVTWDFAVFVINALVFMFIGLQLPVVVSNLANFSRGELLLYSFAVSIVVIAVRFAWVFPATYIPRLIFSSIRRRDPSPPWQAITVLAWTGMRGIVSLAAALSLPETLPSGDPFPARSLLIFLTYAVILTTLIVPATSLPWLLRRLGIQAGDENAREEIRARVAAIRSALNALDTPADIQLYSSTHVEQIRQRYTRRLKLLEANIAEQAYSPIDPEDQRQRRLLRDALRWERQALEQQRRAGDVHDEVFHALSNELDLEELRLNTQRL